MHADPDHWPSVTHGQDAAIAVLQQQVADIQAQLTASADVISAARHAARWWWAVCDDYPRLAAPWVGPLNLALRRLDKL